MLAGTGRRHLRTVIRKIVLAAALCALAVVGAGSASAATYMHGGTATGNVLAAGTSIQGTQNGNALFTSSSGNITCATGGFTADVGASGGATVTATLTSFTIGPCTDSMPLIEITGCAGVNLANTGMVASSASTTGGMMNLTNLVFYCSFRGGGGCTWSATSMYGSYTNVTGNLAYSNVALTASEFGCPSTATFSVMYNPVGTAGGAKLYLNNAP